MKKFALILFVLTLTTHGFSQNFNTFDLDNKPKKTFVGFGGPLLNWTQVNKEHGILLGGRGGVIVNHKFAFGGIGMGLVSKPEFVGADIVGNNQLQLQSSLGAGGVFVEYFINPGCPAVLSVPVNILAGGISLKDALTYEKVESSGLFIIEPGINILLPVCKNFMPAINISYRQVLGSSLINLDNSDISGLKVGLVFNFGNFR